MSLKSGRTEIDTKRSRPLLRPRHPVTCCSTNMNRKRYVELIIDKILGKLEFIHIENNNCSTLFGSIDYLLGAKLEYETSK